MKSAIEQLSAQLASVLPHIIVRHAESLAEKYPDKIKVEEYCAKAGIKRKIRVKAAKEEKKCKKCDKKAFKGSQFCEEHKRKNNNEFKLQVNRTYKVKWNAHYGLVPKTSESKVIIGKIENGMFVKELSEKDLTICKKYGLTYEPGELPKIDKKAKKSEKPKKEKKEKEEKKDKEKDKKKEKPKSPPKEETDNEEEEEEPEEEEETEIQFDEAEEDDE